MKKIYCAGAFNFDYLEENYLEKVKNDYRSKLLGDAKYLLSKSSGKLLKEDLTYIGPFYFESDGMLDEEIVATEVKMIEECTDAVFLLDNACCPGTIGELLLATLLEKQVAIFYVEKGRDEETESSLHTPCWFPIIMSKQKNKNTYLYACTSKDDAIIKILKYVYEEI